MADGSLAPIGERVLFENEHVRVWENVVEPGEESPVHRHDHDYLAIDIEGDRVVHNPVKDGHFPRMEHEVGPAGSVIHLRGGVTETAINAGTTRIRTILVELLDDPR
jgi:beta-alanine degradation protein BauB